MRIVYSFGNDSISGDAGNDVLVGSGGFDTTTGLFGGGDSAGDDTFSGGAGNDTIIIQDGDSGLSTDGTGVDAIIGFQTGLDKIDVNSGAVSGAGPYTLGAAPALSYNELTTVFSTFAAARTAAESATSANSVVVAQVGSDVYLFVDSNGNGAFGSGDDVIKLQGVTYAGIAAGDVI